MAIKKFCQRLLLLLSIFLILPSSAQMNNPIGQTLQINTRFSRVIGSPIWTLIIRDMDSERVVPYVFDISAKNNFWVAFTYSRNYRITVSNLKFGPYAIVNNFCHLENGVLCGKSMWITLSGELSPDRRTVTCHVNAYKDMPFPIAVDSLSNQ